MHSSRMHTAHNSSHRGRGLPQCMLGYTPPGCGPGDLPAPVDVSLETPPGQTPQLPPSVWAWRPPWPDLSTSPLGVDLETYKACWDTIPPRPAARHAGIPPAMHAGIPPPVTRITDMCKNITLPQLRCGQ